MSSIVAIVGRPNVGKSTLLGFDDEDHEPLLKQVREQVLRAVEEADRIIFMVDGPQGLMPGDEDMANLLRRSEKEVFLAVNKIDGPEHDHLLSDFYSLGVDKIYPISAAHGYGLKAFMEDLGHELPKLEPEMEENGRIRVAILGRPNVGKSSLINRILGFERLLVSEVPGTTRDSVDTLFAWQGKEYLLIDTAMPLSVAAVWS
jgi:GTP-binding protein